MIAWPTMGVHAPYVWGSVGAVLLFIAIEVAGLRARRRRALAAAAARRPAAKGAA